jgi:cytoskeletal protein RodZ
MLFFEKKRIASDEETVGRQLRRTREERKLSLETVAKKLNIRLSYLTALETGDRRQLPKGVYARNFLREYARFLGLDYRLLLAQFAEEDTAPPESANEALFERKVVKRRQLISMPIVTRNIIIAVVAAVCLLYLGFLLKNIFQPPLLELLNPAEDKTTTERQLEIKGRTEPETDVTINDQTVQVAADGSFNEAVYLEPGLNTITVKANKKHSRQASIVRHVLLEEPSPNN